jgi:hypothetical protein
LTGILEKGLMNKVGPAKATMDPVLVFTTLFCDWSNAAVLLDGAGVGIT